MNTRPILAQLSSKGLIFLTLIFLLCLTDCKKEDKAPVNQNIIKDADGNVYTSVQIGTQVWLVENLKTTKFRNNDPIPNITETLAWGAATTSAYCNLSNDEVNANLFGRLYNWYAVNDNRNIAPPGWHIPSDAEWATLESFLGGGTVAGGKLKESGSAHWCNQNVGGTNESGFKALPGGTRTDKLFVTGCQWGTFWSSTEFDADNSYNRILFDTGTEINRVDNNKKFGMSVRCIKD